MAGRLDGSYTGRPLVGAVRADAAGYRHRLRGADQTSFRTTAFHGPDVEWFIIRDQLSVPLLLRVLQILGQRVRMAFFTIIWRSLETNKVFITKLNRTRFKEITGPGQ